MTSTMMELMAQRNALAEILSGVEDDLAGERERVRVLSEALSTLLDRYVDLVTSGDCGFWDAEREDEVIAAREALAGGGQPDSVPVELPARPSWNTPSRPRYEANLFGERKRPDGPKKRWIRRLRATGTSDRRNEP